MGEVPLVGFVGLLVGLVIGMAGVYVLARLRAQTDRALAEQIIANAVREAETMRRQADVAANEDRLRRREELDGELESINPTRIEEVVRDTREDMERHIHRLGQEAALEANVIGLHETLEKYVRRLEELESLALGFPGVEQAYAIQAGRESRVLVDSQQLGDAESAALCREIAQSIESSLNYPGEVKVTMLRETRTIEFAR